MADSNVLRGSYTFEHGRFVSHGDVDEIEARIRKMKLLFDAGSGVPSFYRDVSDGSYWEYTQSEDYTTQLRPVSRSEITKKFPSVDVDREIEPPQ